MAKEHELLRALIRETLKLTDRDRGKATRAPVLLDPLGPPVRVQLNGRTWLTRSQAEVERVIDAGGGVVMRNGVPVTEAKPGGVERTSGQRASRAPRRT